MLWRDVLPRVLHRACAWIAAGLSKYIRKSPGAYPGLFMSRQDFALILSKPHHILLASRLEELAPW